MASSPYPGLRPYYEDEVDIFFGRDDQVLQMLGQLSDTRFLMVVGPSGCGKSSLVRTGLINALKRGLLDGTGSVWSVAYLRPGDHPMARLANALSMIGSTDDNSPNTLLNKINNLRVQSIMGAGGDSPGLQQVEDLLLQARYTLDQAINKTVEQSKKSPESQFVLATLDRGPLGLMEFVREGSLPENANLLVLVDQFEEIFRYHRQGGRDEAEAFVSLLLESVRNAGNGNHTGNIYVLMTMRSDFLGDCALFEGLPEAINSSQFLTPRMTREQLREAIELPARVFAGEVEPNLVNTLLNDTGTNPDQLPLLQHVLSLLWSEAYERNPTPGIRMSLEDYEKLGGFQDALSNHADQIFNELSPEQQVIARRIFQCLTQRNEYARDTRRPVSVGEVAEVAGVEIEQIAETIDFFRKPGCSFITPYYPLAVDADTILDISHESLIRQWSRLTKWVDEEANSVENYITVTRKSVRWLEKNRTAVALLTDFDIEHYNSWKENEKPNSAWAKRYGGGFPFDPGVHFRQRNAAKKKKRRRMEKE